MLTRLRPGIIQHNAPGLARAEASVAAALAPRRPAAATRRDAPRRLRRPVVLHGLNHRQVFSINIEERDAFRVWCEAVPSLGFIGAANSNDAGCVRQCAGLRAARLGSARRGATGGADRAGRISRAQPLSTCAEMN